MCQVGRKTPDSWVPSVLAAGHLYWAVVTGRDLVRDRGGESRAEDWGRGGAGPVS